MEAEGISIPTDPDSPPVGSPEIANSHFDDEVSQPSVEQHHSSQTVTLTDDLRHKIIKQVEYYFSDKNLQTDKFLMNYVTKDKEGFVPISVIASFKKMKKLAPDRSLIVAALKESSLLVLSSSKKKVKRLHPLPFNEVEDPQLCTVLVENLPEDHSTENIRKIFCKAGNIKNICIRDPNVSREPKNRTIAEKLLSGKLHALVEYETVESAEKAVVTLNDEQDWRYGMRVKLLKQRGKYGQRKTARKVSGSENDTSVQTSDPAGEEDNHVSSEHHDDAPGEEEPVPSGSISRDGIEYMYTTEASGSREENGPSPVSNFGPQIPQSSLGRSSNGLHMGATMASIEVLNTVVLRRLMTLTLSILKASKEWLERQKPLFITVSNYVLNARDYVRMKVVHAYPIVLRWTMHFANILLLLAMVWLECSLRGIDSLLRMGTTSFFVVIWCSTFSLVTMIGVTKILVVLAIAAFMGLMAGLTIATLLIAFSGIVFLWLYGSFWTTMLVIFFGGLSFTFSHERVALSIITVYSVYCAWMYVGWLGLLLGLNLSFISSDALIFFLRNNLNEHRRANSAFEQAAGSGIFSGEQWNASSPETGSGLPSDRSPGVPSTSGFDSDVTSEDEVGRLLNSTDHYSALGFSRFENVDVSILKREYRKKAMLVHPDKNMGNEKAAEAFKKLQNAYEVLLDSLKRKSYDDELRREELLNYFRRFQNGSQQDRGHSFFSSRFKRTEADVEDPLGESRRMACRKCNSFHVWFPTKKSKSRARWCQDCNDFHQAKDGDGWVEQSSQPFFFGLLQKVDAPCAYVCADSKIYDATEWYICQGMRCPVNTHKPSFHVNTSVTSKHSSGKGNSGQRGGGIPSSNMEETMTEEEFEEWLLNAMQAGMFDNFAGGNSDSPSTRAGTSFKSGGGNPGGGGTSSSGGKRKKKGKKQW